MHKHNLIIRHYNTASSPPLRHLPMFYDSLETREAASRVTSAQGDRSTRSISRLALFLVLRNPKIHR
ncbi:hypothetical protein EVAR_90558_1 [Eumeta japonica]|uniref:Uncharacterized protein n=1 Tax=Eumeta variegata TaxID=151549 RepID=A0A4C2AFP7_EUMVA|nr:hypothetical protein EVAR_90558_1 [Eumeta japonica]